MKTVVVSLLVCLSGWASADEARILKDNPCPQRQVFSPIDLDKISGFWYLLYEYKSSSTPEEQCDCSVYDIQLSRDPRNCYVQGCCRKFETQKDKCESIPKKLTFRTTAFDKFDPEAATKGVFDGVNEFFFTIFDTDYDNYAVAYACKNLADGKSQEEIRIGSRTADFSPEIQEKVDKIIDGYFDRPMLRKIEHDEGKCSGMKEALMGNLKKLPE